MSKAMNREQRRKAQKNAKANARLDMQLRIHRQIATDALCLAANDVLHAGPKVLPEVVRVFTEYYAEICDKIVGDDFFYAMTLVDRRLEKICGDRFMPAEQRYNMAIRGVGIDEQKREDA